MRNRSTSPRLLPPDALVKTGDVDHADWNHRPLLGSIMRLRFALIIELLAGRKFPRLLEIGYGSGVFLPELSRSCEDLYGIDVHPSAQAVARTLAGFDVAAKLFSGSATAMPFADDFFDAVVAVSALEFIEDLDAACLEIRRVLRPGGRLFIITPGYSPIADFGLRILTGKSAKDDYSERRQRLLPTIRKHFAVERQLTAPPFGGTLIRLYTALELRGGQEPQHGDTEKAEG